jgi:DNA-binding MarR family transcriptional regulator
MNIATTSIVGTIIGMPSKPLSRKPEGCTHARLRQLDRALARHYDAYVGSTGLKITQYSLLSRLAGAGPLRPSELAARARMDASTLTRNLQPLIAAGWVAVGAGEDGRSRRVEITAAGRAKRAEAQPAWQAAQQALNARLGHDRVADLHDLIAHCLERLDATHEEDCT